ncbi:MAG: DegT/DnrJ/EryC1/StrS family aminotransferase, partial [Candidatus Marsarchaeota archaeon]|nr:DegT/DnrJ/EryC1/StrS family aminotransferase [Candidatus Marsarchaeota archaeon]
ARRQEIAGSYDIALASISGVEPLKVRNEVSHVYHLYVIRLDPARLSWTRAEIFTALRAEGIGVNVHYVPAHLHPFYQRQFHTSPKQCPVAEAAYEQIVSLPIFPAMTEDDVADVIAALRKVLLAASQQLPIVKHATHRRQGH